MDKETVKRFAKLHMVIPCAIGDDAALLAFAQACCDWQKDKDAQICEETYEEYFCGEPRNPKYICADAIRNAKSIPEDDIEQARRIR